MRKWFLFLIVLCPFLFAGSIQQRHMAILSQWNAGGVSCASGTSFDEKFEGAGYEEAWDSGETGTVDEDYDTSNVGSPSCWDSQCLRVTSAGASSYVEDGDIQSNLAVSYTRFEIYLVSESLSGNAATIVSTYNDGWSGSWKIYAEDDSGTVSLWIQYWAGAGEWVYDQGPNISTGQRYYVEVKYDVTGSAYEWKVDGVQYGSGSSLTNMQSGIRYLTIGWEDPGAAGEICIDNLLVSTAGYPS